MTPETQPRTEAEIQMDLATVREVQHGWTQPRDAGNRLAADIESLQRRLADAERLLAEQERYNLSSEEAFQSQIDAACDSLAAAEAKLAKVREAAVELWTTDVDSHWVAVTKADIRRKLERLLGESVGGDQDDADLIAEVERRVAADDGTRIDLADVAAAVRGDHLDESFTDGSVRSDVAREVVDVEPDTPLGGTPEPPPYETPASSPERTARLQAAAEKVEPQSRRTTPVDDARASGGSFASSPVGGTQPEPQRCAHCNETIFMSRVGWLHGEPPRGTEFCRFPRRNSQVMNPRATPPAAPPEGEPT